MSGQENRRAKKNFFKKEPLLGFMIAMILNENGNDIQYQFDANLNALPYPYLT
ncbi:hypothetical protein SOASR032_11670 [Pragia fontium]|uniref:Uncharacterized protein n=1 Tax=Pragia fontium TaxID=82985 RepID=A0ABQ5LG93_9GAMM|nr:hypothetical protein SOASR032_11670 [Pragia fontium]